MFEESYGEDLIDEHLATFSFSSRQNNAILLYMYDHLNNFLEIRLKDGNNLVLRYNSGKNIVEGRVLKIGKMWCYFTCHP